MNNRLEYRIRILVRRIGIIAVILPTLLCLGCGPDTSPVQVGIPAQHTSKWVDVKDDNSATSSIQISPREFGPDATTSIEFFLPVDAIVSLSLYDINGIEINKLLDREPMAAGQQLVDFNASNMSSGVFVFTLVFQGLSQDLTPDTQVFVESRKMILLK